MGLDHHWSGGPHHLAAAAVAGLLELSPSLNHPVA